MFSTKTNNLYLKILTERLSIISHLKVTSNTDQTTYEIEKFIISQNQNPKSQYIMAHFICFLSFPFEKDIPTDLPDLKSTIQLFINSKSWKNSRNKSLNFKISTSDHSTLCVDVSHTYEYDRNTGVQRVVRKIAENLESIDPTKILYFKFENDFGMRPLRVEADRLINFKFNTLESADTKNKKIRLIVWNSLVVMTQLLRMPVHFFVTFTCWALFFLFGHSHHLNIRIQKLQRSLLRLSDFMADITEPPLDYFGKLLGVRNDKKLPTNLVVPIGIVNNYSNTLLPELRQDEFIDFYTHKAPLLKSKLYAVFYDLIPLQFPFDVSDHVKANFVSYLQLFQNCERVFCISKFALSQISDALKLVRLPGTKEPKLVFTPLGYDIKKTIKNSQKIDVPIRKIPLIISVGTIEPRKNQLRTLLAAKKILEEGHKFELIFIGSRTWECKEFYNLISTLHSQGHSVACKHGFSDEQLTNYYSNSLFTVFISLAEGFGLPIIESFAFDKPCLASNTGAVAEVAKQGPSLLVDPTSIDDIANGFRELLLNNDKRQALIQKEYIQWPTWKQFTQQLLNEIALES